jgi:hypothetical protein
MEGAWIREPWEATIGGIPELIHIGYGISCNGNGNV